MKNLLSIHTLLAVLFVAATAQAKLNVVATTADLGALAREVGGDKITITSLARPTEDSHFVDARPSFIRLLNQADVLIEGGAELEAGWLAPLLNNARNPRILSTAPGHILALQGIRLLEVPTGAVDRSQGDVHAAGNPHFLMDPANARIVAAHIADSFCKIDAAACEIYRANLKQFTDALDARLAIWEKTLAPFQGQRIVSYHNSWPYFSDRFGVKVDLFLEPKPGIPPTPAHLASVITQMKEQKIRVIFVEPFLNRKTAETVARATGATLVDVSLFPGGLKGTEGDYLKLFDAITDALARALSAPPK